MKKRIMAVLIAVTMLAGMGTMADAAQRPSDRPAAAASRVIVDEETGMLILETSEEFLEFYSVNHYVGNFKSALKEYFLDEENADELAQAKEDYGVDSIDAVVNALWNDGGVDFFCDKLSELFGFSITPENYLTKETQRKIYIAAVSLSTDGEITAPDDLTYEEIVNFIIEMYEEEPSSGSDETTTDADDETTTDADDETTTAPDDETTTAPEEESSSDAGDETTTVSDETTTKKAETSTSPNTGDPSMLLAGAFALMGGVGVVAARKRKK